MLSPVLPVRIRLLERSRQAQRNGPMDHSLWLILMWESGREVSTQGSLDTSAVTRAGILR
jgi:hypothetical protein